MAHGHLLCRICHKILSQLCYLMPASLREHVRQHSRSRVPSLKPMPPLPRRVSRLPRQAMVDLKVQKNSQVASRAPPIRDQAGKGLAAAEVVPDEEVTAVMATISHRLRPLSSPVSVPHRSVDVGVMVRRTMMMAVTEEAMITAPLIGASEFLPVTVIPVAQPCLTATVTEP